MLGYFFFLVGEWHQAVLTADPQQCFSNLRRAEVTVWPYSRPHGRSAANVCAVTHPYLRERVGNLAGLSAGFPSLPLLHSPPLPLSSSRCSQATLGTSAAPHLNLNELWLSVPCVSYPPPLKVHSVHLLIQACIHTTACTPVFCDA